MTDQFDFQKAMERLAYGQDLASARTQYDQFRRLLKEAAKSFEVKCEVTDDDDDPPRLRVKTPLGTAIGRMSLAFSNHPYAVVLFDGERRDDVTEPLYSVSLTLHVEWSDSEGKQFNPDRMNDTYTVGVGRVALTNIVRAQMAVFNAELERHRSR